MATQVVKKLCLICDLWEPGGSFSCTFYDVEPPSHESPIMEPKRSLYLFISLESYDTIDEFSKSLTDQSRWLDKLKQVGPDWLVAESKLVKLFYTKAFTLEDPHNFLYYPVFLLSSSKVSR
jgi:hypothetical protein